MSRPARALIKLDNLRHNCAVASRQAPGSRIVAVVKANAYGHGAATIATALEPQVDAFAVACIEEARQLRQAGLSKPVLLLEGPFHPQELEEAAAQKFWLMLHTRHQIDWVRQSSSLDKLCLWLKVDTGMHRLGLTPAEAHNAYQTLMQKCPTQTLTVATHFATADQPDIAFTQQQWQQFTEVISRFDCQTSVANSATIMAWPHYQADFIRPGLMLYGSSPFEFDHPAAQSLQPVMSLQSQVIAVRTIKAGDCVGYGRRWQATRDSVIATVAVGYGDGYPRHAPNGTPVIIEGHRVPLAGTVSMDMITVDITDQPDIQVGAPVELWGETLRVEELAKACDTISYELLTRMPLRTPRVYV